MLKPGVEIEVTLRSRIRATLRAELAPRHVPAEILATPEVPRTLNGKKLEVPVKKILLGSPIDAVASRDTLANPSALDAFAAIANRVP